ncbi:MAG: MotA/TolQ/ExbB proton channel family protein [Capsulimonadaceae bacterium]|nr:MotA/TolQ/ExbB proton channel family protein [Capsulimonadaceae bacterium]
MTEHRLFADPVVIILGIASLASWAIIFGRLTCLRLSVRADEMLLKGKSDAGSPIAGLRAEVDRQPGASREHLATLLDTLVRREKRRLEGQLPLLGAIGATAPYVGLLGTVIGIIQAFQAIQAHNDMSPAVVSGGIATALVATAAGLAVAIPAVAAHHLLTAAINRRAEAWEEDLALRLPDQRTGRERME